MGMMSIGYNPTVTDEHTIKIEVNLLNFDGDLYSETLEVEMIEKLRDEQKFESLDALKQQLHNDKAQTLSILSDL